MLCELRFSGTKLEEYYIKGKVKTMTQLIESIKSAQLNQVQMLKDINQRISRYLDSPYLSCFEKNKIWEEINRNQVNVKKILDSMNSN